MKRIISMILIVAMFVGVVPVAYAARSFSKAEIMAENLKAMGIFRGVSDTDFDLDRAPTRVEALVMLVRLLGKEAAAQNSNATHPFTDVPQWADGYVGYAYREGLTKGISDTQFGTGNANVQMYLTFVLRALDYSDTNGADFSYSEPYTLSYQTGILPDGVDQDNFLRADVVMISYAAMSAYIKNTATTLSSKLIDEGVFTKEQFDTYYTDVTDAELSSEEIYNKCSPCVFYVENYDKRGQLTSTGSGFFIDENGTAVTNYHVIDGAASLKIKVGDTDTYYDVEGVYDCNEDQDWAVIKVSGSGFDYLKLGDAKTVVGGATVYAIGSPLGLQNTISQGLISNVKRELDGVTFIQTSAAISSGSSGGALINKYGDVIGITSAKFSEGENLGLALPISVIDGYKNTQVVTLSELFAQATPEYDAATVLSAFIYKNRNENFDSAIAYTERKNTQTGYIEASAVLNFDYSLEVLIWEVSGNKTYYMCMDLSGDSVKELYYDYEDTATGARLIGVSDIKAADVKENWNVTFQETDGNIQTGNHENLASRYALLGLSFINDIFESVENIGTYSVADLGFINYK